MIYGLKLHRSAGIGATVHNAILRRLELIVVLLVVLVIVEAVR